MGPANNNNEFFELLDGTESNSSEIQQLVLPARKKRFRRRLRNNPTIVHDDSWGIVCHSKGRTVTAAVLAAVAVSWLLSLTWLAIVLHNKVGLLNHDIENLQKLVAAHEGVPDALHACHSLSRELRKNQSDMNTRLAEMAAIQQNVTLNLTRIESALSAVQQQLNASPSLVNDPRLVKDLSKQVAEFGSKIQDLQTTAASLKEHDSRLDGTLQTVSSNVTDLHAQVSSLVADRGGVSATQLSEAKSSILQLVNGLSANLTTLNETLSSRLNWTDHDQFQDHKTVVSLQEMDQNITARLRTLEEIMIKNTTPSPVQQLAKSELPVLSEQEPTPVVTGSSPAAQVPPGAPARSNIPPLFQTEKPLDARP